MSLLKSTEKWKNLRERIIIEEVYKFLQSSLNNLVVIFFDEIQLPQSTI